MSPTASGACDPQGAGGGIVTDVNKLLLGTAVQEFAFLVYACDCLGGCCLGAGVHTHRACTGERITLSVRPTHFV